MKRYIDINKSNFLSHNAKFVKKKSGIQPKKNSYIAETPQNDYYPDLDENTPDKEGSSKFYITLAAAIFFCLLYIYSEATNNEKSIFFSLREIGELYFNKNKSETETTGANKTDENASFQANQLTLNKAVETTSNPPTETNPIANNNQATSVQNSSTPIGNIVQDTQQATSQSKWVLPLFLSRVDENENAIFYPHEHDFSQLGDELEYGHVIKQLAEYASSNGETLNFFDNNVIVKRAWMENDTLIIDFNRAFEYSKYGPSGINARIQQLLWTVFNLPKLMDSKQIKSNQPISFVSILIDGRRKSNIGGDGMTLSPFYSFEDLTPSLALAE